MEQKDIERVTPLIRALYIHQPVMMHPDWECFNDNRPTMVEAHHFEDLQKKRWDKGYLLLRPLSSITDEEMDRVATIINPERINKHNPRVLRTNECAFINFQGYEVATVFFNGTVMYKDLNGVDTYTLKAYYVYQYLIQQSFALPYYDSSTNTTITPEQMQEYGIIKLKERL